MNERNQEIKNAFLRTEAVVYKDGGNRIISGEAMLSRAQLFAEKIGVTSLNKISPLIHSSIPIYLSTRPNSHNHYLYGGSLSSLGKGTNDLQAKISCLMESIEYSCIENIPNDLIRASFDFLSKSHATIAPHLFFRMLENIYPSENDALMWTHAYCPSVDQEVLIPAELVYFPFQSENYKTNHYYSPSTNGLASGASYLEAIVHSLYEIIERAFIGHKELKMGYRTALQVDEFLISTPDFLEHKKQFELEFYLVESFLLPTIPVVECIASYNGKKFAGHGCSLNFTTALERAYSEALQSASIYAISNREDIFINQAGIRSKFFSYSEKKLLLASEDFLPPKIISFEDSIQQTDLLHKFPSLDLSFETLNDEYDALLDYLKRADHEHFYIVNLSPKNDQIFVVKTVSPSLMSKASFYQYARYQNQMQTRMASFQYRNSNEVPTENV